MSPPELDDLKRQLLVAASVEDPTERLLEVAAVVSDALADLGIQPVVVGGLALAYWSGGGEYITGDIDVLLPRLPALAERLDELGLWRLREWLHWHHSSCFHQAAHLLVSEEMDGARLDQRAREEGLHAALGALRSLTAEISAGREIEEWEIVELGRAVEHTTYSSKCDE